jgi:hypothetical protein
MKLTGLILASLLFSSSGVALAADAPASEPPSPARPAEPDPEQIAAPHRPDPAGWRPQYFTADRPMRTLPTALLEKWGIQFENGFDFASTRYYGKQYVLYTTPTKLRVGVHERIELFVFTDAFCTRIARGDYADDFGFADVAAGVKFNFTKGGEWKGFEPMITLHLSIVMPTGTSGFTLKTWVPKAVLALSWKVPGHFIVTGNIGSQMLLAPDGNRYFQGIYGAAIQRPWAPLVDSLGNFIEVTGDLEFSPDAQNTLTLSGGFYYVVDHRFRVDLSVRGGLAGMVPDVAGMIGASIRL